MDNNQQKDNRPGGGRMPNGNKVPFMAILAIALVVILGNHDVFRYVPQFIFDRNFI